jgi:hypothetical protein
MTERSRRRIAGSFGGLVGAVVALAGGLIMTTSTAAAANPGDIWLTNVGSAVNQGHVPHLQFKDIAMLANYPGAGAGTYTIVAWKPTGDNKSVVYSGTWTYNSKGADIQQIAVVPIDKLYSAVQKLGIQPQAQQGFHFKMFCSIGKHDKMKEFWVAAPTSPPNVIVTPTPSPSGAVAGETGSRIGLAETGGPLLGFGLLLMLLGGFTWLSTAVARRRS